MARNLKIYCTDEDTQSDVIAWLKEFWSDELTKISSWVPDLDGEGSYGVFADGASDDLKDDLLEIFEDRVEAEFEE